MADTFPPTTNGGSNLDTLKGNTQAAINSVTNGPVAQNVKDQTAKTNDEFSNLANARQRPSNPTATGQPLTHYHSFFSELLSWRNPRASGIAYVALVGLIFAFRYLDILRYGFKLTYLALGVTVAAEVAGKAVLNNGLATQFRPRKYYTVPRETLDALIGDVHELINFFVIESQRIVFAENVYASAAACVAAFLSYYLVKIVPYWGLSLIGLTTLFLVPLIYTSNQELIDHHLKQASDIVNTQTAQIRQVAGQHTAHATEVTKQYMGDYTAKAQELLRGRSSSPEVVPKSSKQYQETDFPAAPKKDFKLSEPEFKETEPLIKREGELPILRDEPLIST